MKGLPAQAQISKGRRCLPSFLNRAGSYYIFFESCVSAVCVYSRDTVMRLRAWQSPWLRSGGRNAPGTSWTHKKDHTCLFARMQFSVPEIPSEPVTGVEEGTRMEVRGCSATYFWRRSLTHFSLPTPSATSKIDTWTLIKCSGVFPYQLLVHTLILCLLYTVGKTLNTSLAGRGETKD